MVKIRATKRLGRSNKTFSMLSLAETASLFRKLIIELGLILLVLFALGLFIRQVLRTEIILDPIQVPEDVAKLGFTEIIVAEQLADAVLNIRFEAYKFSYDDSWSRWENDPGLASAMKLGLQDIAMNVHLQDILIPGAPFSIRSIARFVRQELGLPSIHLRGEIVHADGGLVLTLRNLSTDKVPPVHIAQAGKEVEQLFPKGGAALLKLTAPSALAIYNLNKWIHSPSQREDYEQLVQLFEYCLTYPPTADDAIVHSLWGGALLFLKRYDESMKHFEQALTLDPKLSHAYSGQGAVHFALNRPDEAITQFKKAIALNPNDVDTLNNLGGALSALKRYDEGITQFKKAIALDPRYATAYFNWGVDLKELERYEDAIKKYEKAVEINPRFAVAFASWGDVLQKLERYEDAIKKYQKAVEINPRYATAYFNWGVALQRLNRDEEAAERFRMESELRGEDLSQP